jgi:hypothetical protein
VRKYYAIDPEEGGELATRALINPTLAALPNTAVNPIVAPVPSITPTLPLKKAIMPTNPNLIPAPDYNNPASRAKYLKNWATQYGNLEGRGDTILKVNEIPRTGTETAKNISKKAASQYGIDPALLYTSFMEEGGSGLFKDKGTGIDTKHRKPTDFGYQDYYGDKDYPINGGQSFGFQTFSDRFPDLVRKGYLPKEFSKNFRGKANEGQYSANNFKDVQSAMQAKAALLKYHYDDIDSYAAHRGIKLSPKARDFFALASYNGGEGGGHQLMHEYNEKGLLEGDRFLKERPESSKKAAPNLDIWSHVSPRIKRRDALKEQTLFE